MTNNKVPTMEDIVVFWFQEVQDTALNLVYFADWVNDLNIKYAEQFHISELYREWVAQGVNI